MDRFGFTELPSTARKYIARKAVERANGSSMLLEWMTFALTIEEWVKACEDNGVPLPDDVKNTILQFGE